MPIYMQYDGADGDVTADSHKGWIALHSVQWGTARSVSTSGEANNRTKSTAQVREVVVTLDRDSSTGTVLRDHFTNTDKTVVIDWTATSQGNATIFQSVKLTHALVSSFGMSGHANDKPLVQLSLNYTEIEWTFYAMPGAGTKSSKPFVISYNLSKG